MKTTTNWFFNICLLLLLFTCVPGYSQFNETLVIDYFGQEPPGNTRKVFSPDFISLPGIWVQNCCFSADGQEFIYSVTDSVWSRNDVMYTRYNNGKWSAPKKIISFMGQPYFSYDGKYIFGISRKLGGSTTGDVWVSERGSTGWKDPVRLNFPVNTETADEWEVCISKNNTLYFSSTRPGGLGFEDIYRAFPGENGIYDSIEHLGNIINTDSRDECPYIAPDESFMVFNSWKNNPKFGGNNIYVSHRQKNGSWSSPKDLGNRVNTNARDIYPYITPDGKYLIYTIRSYGDFGPPGSRLYWIGINVLDSETIN